MRNNELISNRLTAELRSQAKERDWHLLFSVAVMPFTPFCVYLLFWTPGLTVYAIHQHLVESSELKSLAFSLSHSTCFIFYLLFFKAKYVAWRFDGMGNFSRNDTILVHFGAEWRSHVYPGSLVVLSDVLSDVHRESP